MDPTTYCRATIAARREEQGGRVTEPVGQQMVVILSTFGQRELTARDFTLAISRLIESSERSGRPKVAAAARGILADWQAGSAAG